MVLLTIRTGLFCDILSNVPLFFILLTKQDIESWFCQILTVLIDGKLYLVMSQDRKMYKCTCADCGKDSEVPFEPKEGRPVYCRECLPKHRK